MNSTAQVLADFCSQVTQLLQERDKEWEASRKLVEARQLTATFKRLIEEAHHVDLPVIIRDAITLTLGNEGASQIQDLPGHDSKNTQDSLRQKPCRLSVCGSALLRARCPSGQ
jgi:hypothetical protein